jgi:hypothetical protein
VSSSSPTDRPGHRRTRSAPGQRRRPERRRERPRRIVGDLGQPVRMTLDQVEAFLVLAEELHFGRTTQRLFLSQSRVSSRIVSLQAEASGSLLDQSSRRVWITTLGVPPQSRLRAERDLCQLGLDEASSAARCITVTRSTPARRSMCREQAWTGAHHIWLKPRSRRGIGSGAWTTRPAGTPRRRVCCRDVHRGIRERKPMISMRSARSR